MNIRYEYSPETFSQTETEYAAEVCEAVKKTWLAGTKSVFADGRKEERIIFVRADQWGIADLGRISLQRWKYPHQTVLRIR